MKERRKKLWSVLLTLALLASLLPVAAVPAAAEDAGRWDALCSQLEKSQTVKVAPNFNIGSELRKFTPYLDDRSAVVPEGVTATLDMNGKTVKAAYEDNTKPELYAITVKGKLTIVGTGTIKGATKAGIFVDGGELVLSGNVTISGNGTYGILVKNGGKVTISGSDAHISGSTYGVLIEDASTVSMSAGVVENSPTGVRVAAAAISSGTPNFSMSGGSLKNNKSGSGGSAVSINSGSVVISGGTITGSPFGVSVPGGRFELKGSASISGITNTGVNVTGGAATISGGTVNCTAANTNGVKVTAGEVTISGGTVSGADNGVIIETTGRVTMSGGTVKDSKNGVNIVSGATSPGGGEHNYKMTGGTLKDNKNTSNPTGSGSGVSINSGSAVISGGTITGSPFAVSVPGGTFELTGNGVLDANINTGVNVTGTSSTFNMTGGTINCTAASTYGIAAKRGISNVSGGTITSTAAGTTGIWVTEYNATTGTVVLSGSGVVSGNPTGVLVANGTFKLAGNPFGSGDYANDVDISLAGGKMITINGELTNTVPISVTADTSNNLYTFTSSLSGKGDKSNFTSAKTGYLAAAVTSSGEAALAKGTATVTVRPASLLLLAGSATYTVEADVNLDSGVSGVTFDRTVTWSSDDETVAAVDSAGKVSPFGIGSATVTATAKANGATATCSVEVKGKQSTPNVTFTALGYDYGVLSDVDGLQYKINDGTYADVPAGGLLTGLNGNNIISVIKKGDGTTTVDSDPQLIHVYRADAPTGLTAGGCTTSANNDGVISGLGAAKGYTYDYKATPTADPTTGNPVPAGATKLENLTYGIYTFRVKAYDVYLTSDDAAPLIIRQKPAAPNAGFEAAGWDSGTLTGLSSGSTYIVSGAGLAQTEVVAAADTFNIASDLSTGTLSVTLKGDGVYTADSDAKTVDVTRMATPALTPTLPKGGGEKGSIPTTSAHEFSEDNTAWTPCTGATENLDAGKTCYVRAKASGTALASDPQAISIVMTYPVTVVGGTVGGQTSAYFAAGDAVAVTATVPADRDFDKWTSDYAISFDATKADTGFQMPAHAVTLTASFKDKASDGGNNGGNSSSGAGIGGGSSTKTYAPEIPSSAHGKVTVDPKSAAAGAKVTVTVTPDEGYEVDSVSVKDANGKDVALTKNTDGTYTYTQPAGKVTVTATFKEKAKETPSESLTVAELMEMFDDLDPNGWYLDDVRYCVENGYMKGMGNNKFGPELNVSRAMIAQLLWNLAGNPEPAGAAPFGDVAADAWYAKAVAWAYENGITKGTGVGFEPEKDITREQLAVMLYNYAKLQGKGFTGLWSFRLDFPDAGEVSDWAVEAVSWMVMNGIINGTGDEAGNTVLDPQGDATRAQLAAMVQRFCELFE